MRLRNRELKRRDIEDASNDMKARVGLAVVDAFREGFRETSLSEKEGCHECLFDDDSPLEIRVEDILDLSDISK